MLQDILEVAMENPNRPLSSKFLSEKTGISQSSITTSLKKFAKRKENNDKLYPGFEIYFEPIGQGRFKIIFTGEAY
ncbi:MAG: hypothetical protein KO464_07135 [Candidatus Methanofastidiosum sp.]|nr:hypothetical protein [Methanofastidiosum sp.]